MNHFVTVQIPVPTPDYTPIMIGVSRPELSFLAVLRCPEHTLEESLTRALELFDSLDPGPSAHPNVHRTTSDDMRVLREYVAAIMRQPQSFNRDLDKYREAVSILELTDEYLG